ncbi:tetratricopeptide repeat protein [Pontiellaceae bacterium B1224]|nr:tetratricopeptide repeat protein [Pontiellaceae bacterium B1224]
MRTIYIFLFAALIILTGCDKDTGSMEAREENDPNVLSGQQYVEQGNYEAAIEEFKRAIELEPLMARPHLDLALIYQNNFSNPIHAIYHYDRYLELRPDSEKAEFINEQKLKVAQSLANTLINNSPEVKKVVQERNTLIQQNNDLKRQLAASLKSKSTPAAPAPGPSGQTVTTTVPKSAAPSAQPVPAAGQKHQIYHVVGGDTLTKIAIKFYSDASKWDIIYEANKEMMRGPGDLKVGQTIVIPMIGN